MLDVLKVFAQRCEQLGRHQLEVLTEHLVLLTSTCQKLFSFLEVLKSILELPVIALFANAFIHCVVFFFLHCFFFL